MSRNHEYQGWGFREVGRWVITAFKDYISDLDI